MRVTDIAQIRVAIEGAFAQHTETNLRNAQAAHVGAVNFGDVLIARQDPHGLPMSSVDEDGLTVDCDCEIDGCEEPIILVLNRRTGRPLPVCKCCINAIKLDSWSRCGPERVYTWITADYYDDGFVKGFKSIDYETADLEGLIAADQVFLDDLTGEVVIKDKAGA